MDSFNALVARQDDDRVLTHGYAMSIGTAGFTAAPSSPPPGSPRPPTI